MLFIIQHVPVLALLLAGGAQAAIGAPEMEEQAVECVQCGTWTIVSSSMASLVAERIVITADQLTIPNCGTHGYSVGRRAVAGVGQQRVFTVDISLDVNSGHGCRLLGGDPPPRVPSRPSV